MSKEIMAALSEEIEERTGERPYELDRMANHNCGESVEDILDMLANYGY